jgi:uncharacterized protein (DUF983 family)
MMQKMTLTEAELKTEAEMQQCLYEQKEDNSSDSAALLATLEIIIVVIGTIAITQVQVLLEIEHMVAKSATAPERIQLLLLTLIKTVMTEDP